MKSIVVLGAADGALSTYRTAAEMGYRTIAVDRSSTAPGIALADEFLPLSTRDTASVVSALAGRADLAGVLAPCSDIALPTLRALALAAGLPPQLSELAVEASVYKPVVRGLLDELGVSSYPWLVGDDPIEFARLAGRLPYPAVVKPADAQGGRGVTRCASPEAVAAAVREAKRWSYGGQVMVEKEIAGTHCSCECVIDDGELVFMAITRQALSAPPRTLTMGHDLPAGLPVEVEDTVRSIVDKLCSRIGYQRGPLNLDLVISPDGEPYVIELGLRTGGNGIDDLVRECHGVDPIRAAVQAAVGDQIEVRPHPPRPVTWRVLTAPRAGQLVAITGQDVVDAMPEVAKLVVLARPGQPVGPYRTVADRVGWFVARADTAAGLDAVAARVAQTLRFDVA